MQTYSLITITLLGTSFLRIKFFAYEYHTNQYQTTYAQVLIHIQTQPYHSIHTVMCVVIQTQRLQRQSRILLYVVGEISTSAQVHTKSIQQKL